MPERAFALKPREPACVEAMLEQFLGRGTRDVKFARVTETLVPSVSLMVSTLASDCLTNASTTAVPSPLLGKSSATLPMPLSDTVSFQLLPAVSKVTWIRAPCFSPGKAY